jgi:CBS domain-containing protein
MSSRPVVIDAFASVQAAAQQMRAHAIGVLPVVEHGNLVGVVTDRDLVVRCVATGGLPWETYVREVMTEDPATCRPAELLTAAVERMIARRVRRLIVVDAGGVVGLLSTDDLVLLDETRVMAAQVLQHRAVLDGSIHGARP